MGNLASILETINFNKAILLLDNNFKIRYANDQVYKTFGTFSLLGKEVKELEHPISSFSCKLRRISQNVLKLKRTAQFIFAFKCPLSKNSNAYYLTISNVQGSDAEETGGLISMIEPAKLNQFASISNLFHSFHKSKKPTSQTFELTQREEEIAFLLQLGKTYKEISQIITQANGKEVSQSTVSSIIQRQLFRKFDVDNTLMLTYKLNQYNNFKSIPTSLIVKTEGIFGLAFE